MRKCGVTSSSHLTQCKRERKKEGETGRVINYLWYIYFPWNSDVEGYYIKDASLFRQLGMGEPWQTQVTQVPPTNLRITFNAISDCKPLVLGTFNLDNRSLYSLVVGTQKYFWVICTREVRQRRSLHNVGLFLQQILLRAPHGVIASFYYYRIQGLQHRSTVDLNTTMWWPICELSPWNVSFTIQEACFHRSDTSWSAQRWYWRVETRPDTRY